MEKRKNYLLNYKKENYKRIPLDINKDEYEKIKTHAIASDGSVNGFIKRAIKETMERDNNSI